MRQFCGNEAAMETDMTTPKSFNFTKQAIHTLPAPERGMVSCRDTKEIGLSLYKTATGVVTFFVRKRIKGRDVRTVIGRFPEMAVEQARKRACIIKGEISAGVDPNEKKRRLRQESTFGELFEEYMERYSRPHKRSWRYDEREVNRFLSDWFRRRLSEISRHDVELLHERIGRENGRYQANRILERIRAMYNKARCWGWEGVNPALGIAKFKEASRDRFAQPDELPRLFKAVDEEQNTTARDFLWLSILTGARKSNLLAMQWSEIDWDGRSWRIPDTKNGEAHTVPLTDRAMEILTARQANSSSQWVLPSASSKTGHLADPKKAWRRVLQRAGISDLRIHDIRRTLGSYQAITGASLPVIGKSLGHKSQRATEVYARLNLDPVRASMEAATAAMFERSGKDDRE